MKRLFWSLIALVTVMTAAPVTLFAQIALFQDVTPIAIPANAMVVEMQKQPPKEYPHVGHRTPITMEQAVNMWASSHFQMTGAGENTLRVTVREADIIERLLPVKKGIAGWFRKDQSAEYVATLEIVVALVDVNGRQQGSAEAKTMQSTTVPEGTTEAEKQALWTEMMKKAFGNLDRELLPRARQMLASGG